MTISMKTTFGGVAAAAVAAMTLAGASSASAGVMGCSASGSKQEVGAAVGAGLGGLLGNSVGGRHSGAETVGGAALGAAAGSAVGCEAQKGRDTGSRSSTYSRGGYRLSSDVAPANYTRIGDTFVAQSGVNLRAVPTTGSSRVGRLQAGERFQALAKVRGTEWILVGQGGVGVGYVRGDFVRPEGHRYARSY